MVFPHMQCIRLFDLLNNELYNTVCARDDCLLQKSRNEIL